MFSLSHIHSGWQRWLLSAVIAVSAASAQADNTSVTHSFADESIYGTKKAVLYFTDEQPPTEVAEDQIVGKVITFNGDIQLTIDYERNWNKIRNDSIPHTTGAVSADNRALDIVGSYIPSHRVRLVFSSPSGATIKKIFAEGRNSTTTVSYASGNISENNSLITLSEGGTTTAVSYAVRYEVKDFCWEGSAQTVTIEKTNSMCWHFRSFTVEYEADETRAHLPSIKGDDALFISSRTITIDSDQPGATFYYTTDGSTPTTASTRYTKPFTVSKTTTVKAIAVVSGLKNSAVATATFEKIHVREGITDLIANAEASITEYVRLNNAVVTWVNVFPSPSLTGEPIHSVYIQDPTNVKGAGLLLINPASDVVLHAGDRISGILVGAYARSRHEFSGWRLLDGVSVSSVNATAPAANVTLDEVKSLTRGTEPNTYTELDYLNQRVTFTTTVNSVDAAIRGFEGQLLANPLQFNSNTGEGDNSVQILLPDNDLPFVIGEEYTFTGVLFQYRHVIKTTTLFRTLYVARNEDITDSQGRRLGRLELADYSQRLLAGDESDININARSHEATVTFTSSAPGIVSVDANGHLKALKKGTAVISVTLTATDSYTSITKQVTVNVFQPTYQVRNSDFTLWEEVSFDGYNANGTGVMKYSGYAPEGWTGYIGAGINTGTTTPFLDLADLDNEDYNPVLLAHAVGTGSTALHFPGVLVSGALEVPFNDDQTAYAPARAYALDNDENAAEFTGRPDAVAVDVRGSLNAGKGRFAVVLHTPGTITYPQTTAVEATATAIATAVSETVNPVSADVFQTVTLPLSYSSDLRPAYALVSFATDAAPDALNATAYDNDRLVLRNLRFIYNSELSAATYYGQALVFDANNHAVVNDVYSPQHLSLQSNGTGAVIETAYDAATRVLTVTVKGDDISVNAANKHVYTIAFSDIEVGTPAVATDAQRPAAAYNLAGQRLRQARRGINIVDGRKVIVQ